MSNPISAEPTGSGLLVLFGLVFLAALSLMAASRRYRTVRNTR
jgi:HAMP domain-containing protein